MVVWLCLMNATLTYTLSVILWVSNAYNDDSFGCLYDVISMCFECIHVCNIWCILIRDGSDYVSLCVDVHPACVFIVVCMLHVFTRVVVLVFCECDAGIWAWCWWSRPGQGWLRALHVLRVLTLCCIYLYWLLLHVLVLITGMALLVLP